MGEQKKKETKMRTIKVETQIKKTMEAFIAEHGVTTVDTTIDGARYFLVVPNSLGQGYIRYTTPEGEIWSADLRRNQPAKVSGVARVYEVARTTFSKYYA